MPILDMNRFANALKLRYASKLEDLWYPSSDPFTMKVPKDTNKRGKAITLNPMIDHPSGGTDIVQVLADDNVTEPLQFEITKAKEYVKVTVDNQTIEESKDGGGIESAVDVGMRGMAQAFGKNLVQQVWGNGGGSRGRLTAATNVATTTIHLRTLESIVHFHRGLKLQLAVDDGFTASAGVKPMVTDLTVTHINPDPADPTITVTPATSTACPTAAASDFLFRKGDYQRVLKGIFGWIPLTAPTVGDNWFGVDRSVYVNGLAGHRIAATGSNVEDTLIRSVQTGKLLGGKFDMLFLGSRRYGELLSSMQSKVWVPVSTDKPKISFPGLQLATSAGTITVVDSWGCPDDVSLLTDMSTWGLWSAGGNPHFEEGDGKRWRVESAADALQVRGKAYRQLVNTRAIDSMLITWPT